ncbi:extracellular solute-binding protein [Kineococcus rhizosphaerae]|uniref:Carbohydrate ABC transporter substrate-binding protein (CUT1 family) n=1 Tax=Kineococcus rhizosphaerae TaxID=559628 RepID=A0A2T0R385_9ACTN|nr:extracellular solute-binding protein [Kineococcus rhizosphaerae]PRY14470.1 carbohydrate ABC transporter substrate-binding protein (CUT1 family) [Kineococcus rhizosphaerae]
MNSHPPTPPARGVLSRRNLLRGGLAAGGLGLVAATAGCGSPLAAGLAGSQLDPGTVTFWNLFGGGDGARLQTMLDEYRQQQSRPDSLVAATFAWGNPYYTKVSLATIGDQPPDVAVAHLTRAANLAQAGLLTPITEDMLSTVGLTSADFNQKVWAAQKVNDQDWTVPLDTHPFVMFYNVDVCQKAGLLDGEGKLKPIQGVEEWEAALKAAKQATGGLGLSVANVNEFATPWRFFQTLYSQQEGATDFLSDGGTKITFNEDLTAKTLEYIQKLANDGLISKAADYAGSQTDMFTGKSAFYLQGEWEITTAQGIKDLKFGMVPVPTVFDKPAAQADSHTFVLPKMERSPEQVQRAMGFIKSMLDQSMTWAAGGHVPAYLPTLDSDEYKALEPQADYASAADVAVYDAPAWYSGSGSNFENIVGAQIGLVQQGLSSPSAAISSIRSQLQSYASTANPL